MCGIFALLNANKYAAIDTCMIKHAFNNGKSRGPEFSKLVQTAKNDLSLGFHRLAINGLNEQSNQPLVLQDIHLICNGEIYNYKSLYKYMNITPTTGSDCEVIIHLYMRYGIAQTLLMLDGVFAFVLLDRPRNVLIAARDPLGVRPLYKLHITATTPSGKLASVVGFASELKSIEPFYHLNPRRSCTKQFEPGTYSVYTYKNQQWASSALNKLYYIPAFPSSALIDDIRTFQEVVCSTISHELTNAISKRCTTTERPVACLLSGGLDSSLVAALVSSFFKQKNADASIETYSIGLADSVDLRFARIVANHIGSKHTEIVVTEQEMFDAIPDVIYALESYDTTTVRASIGNYLLGKYISSHSDAKVIFNGDGADELFGGYLYMNKCPDDIEFDRETRRLLKDIHAFDVLRSDKSISSNGLEPRTPFLDRNVVSAVLSIPPYIRNHNNFGEPEKYLLRHSFNNGLLPDAVLWRRKEAFSDGVSKQGRSLYTILQEHIARHYTDTAPCELGYSPNIHLEKKYYKDLFDQAFPHSRHIVPYYWMPKYTDATDPSARTLDVYHE